MDLEIEWKRLVVDGETCERCEGTGEKVEEAVRELERSLRPLGIEVELEKEELTLEDFEREPGVSNEIVVDGRPLEDWIDAETGRTECCDVCGGEKCRTVRTGGEEYEIVPPELVVEAGLKAASELQSRECCSRDSCDCGC